MLLELRVDVDVLFLLNIICQLNSAFTHMLMDSSSSSFNTLIPILISILISILILILKLILILILILILVLILSLILTLILNLIIKTNLRLTLIVYTEEEGGETREEKFDYTSRKIVVTIVGGAITTAGAVAFMFACQMTFFTKMATLIVSTIILSYIFSLFFFMSMLYLAGPSGETGKISPFLKNICNKIEVKICPEQLGEDSDDSKGNEDFTPQISEK